jgi:hypothetical protein
MGNFFKWFWESICNLDALLSILERLGWKEKLGSVMSAGLASMATALVGKPWWVNVLSGFGGLFLALVCLNYFKGNRKKFIKAETAGLKIEYIEDHAIGVGPQEGHGIQEGHWYISRVKISNKNTTESLPDARAAIVSLIDHDEKFPNHLLGKINIPFQLLFSDSHEGVMDLNPTEGKFIDVIYYHQSFWNPNIRMGRNDGPEIFGGPYSIEIQATSRDGVSENTEFIIGLRKRLTGGMSDLCFVPVWVNGITSQQVRDKLITLCADGVHLRNEEITTPGMLDAWQDRYEIWHLLILQMANRFERDLRHKIWPLNTITQYGLGSPFNGEHQQKLNIISEVVARVRNHLGLGS